MLLPQLLHPCGNQLQLPERTLLVLAYSEVVSDLPPKFSLSLACAHSVLEEITVYPYDEQKLFPVAMNKPVALFFPVAHDMQLAWPCCPWYCPSTHNLQLADCPF